jgi:hypothetical protein
LFTANGVDVVIINPIQMDLVSQANIYLEVVAMMAVQAKDRLCCN